MTSPATYRMSRLPGSTVCEQLHDLRSRLQALIERGGLVKLPPALDQALTVFLGSSRRFFWPAPQSLSAAVRTAFERSVSQEIHCLASGASVVLRITARPLMLSSHAGPAPASKLKNRLCVKQAKDLMPLETAMGGLRYLAMLVAAAEANGIIGGNTML